MSAAAGSAAGGAAAAGAAAAPKATPVTVKAKYVCGSCGSFNELGQRDQVRCRICGYRIFYKVRTDKLTQFDAR